MPSFIKIPPLSTEIACHAKQVLTDNVQPDGRPEIIMPVVGRERHNYFKYYVLHSPIDGSYVLSVDWYFFYSTGGNLTVRDHSGVSCIQKVESTINVGGTY